MNPSAVRSAAARIAGQVHRTPVRTSATLDGRTGAQVLVKDEAVQKTGSFKARGALNRLLTLPDEARERGLVCVTAGNHGAAVAWAAAQTGAKATVVMPTYSPAAKVAACWSYGAEVILHGDTTTEAFAECERLQHERGLTFVHPFDDAVVLAGAGTTGLEILEDLPDVDVIVVPVGGGGLLGGVASAVRQLRPAAKIIAVELAEGPGLAPALAAGKPVPVPRPPDTLADGMTPPFVGALPLQIAREAVDAIVAVGEGEIIGAMKLLMTRAKLYVEGSGAAATAAILTGKVKASAGARVAAIVSGGNVDLERIAALSPSRAAEK